MSFPRLELLKPHVAVIWLGDSENRFSTSYLKAIDSLLDKVVNDNSFSDCTMLITCGNGRFYSNGIDLQWLVKQSEEGRQEFILILNKLFARFLTFPLLTVAALNGHAFAGAAMLALAHDCRVMQSRRGWFSLPEAFLGLPFRAGMLDLIRSKVPVSARRDFILLGRRFTAEQGVQSLIVDTAVPTTKPQDLVEEAAKYGESRLPAQEILRATLEMLKSDLYAVAVKSLLEDDGHVDKRIAAMAPAGLSKL